MEQLELRENRYIIWNTGVIFAAKIDLSPESGLMHFPREIASQYKVGFSWTPLHQAGDTIAKFCLQKRWKIVPEELYLIVKRNRINEYRHIWEKYFLDVFEEQNRRESCTGFDINIH